MTQGSDNSHTDAALKKINRNGFHIELTLVVRNTLGTSEMKLKRLR